MRRNFFLHCVPEGNDRRGDHRDYGEMANALAGSKQEQRQAGQKAGGARQDAFGDSHPVILTPMGRGARPPDNTLIVQQLCAHGLCSPPMLGWFMGPTGKNDPLNRAQAAFTASELRDKSVKAEIAKERAATDAKTARLKALRLAKEAEDAARAAAEPKTAGKTSSARSRKKS